MLTRGPVPINLNASKVQSLITGVPWGQSIAEDWLLEQSDICLLDPYFASSPKPHLRSHHSLSVPKSNSHTLAEANREIFCSDAGFYIVLQMLPIVTSPGICTLKFIAGSEKTLFGYLQVDQTKNARESITKDITKKYFPCIFILPKSEPLSMSNIGLKSPPKPYRYLITVSLMGTVKWCEMSVVFTYLSVSCFFGVCVFLLCVFFFEMIDSLKKLNVRDLYDGKSFLEIIFLKYWGVGLRNKL